METWVFAILALLVVLILGGFSAALVAGFFRGPRTAGRRQDESLEAKAERLQQMVHPDKDAPE